MAHFCCNIKLYLCIISFYLPLWMSFGAMGKDDIYINYMTYNFSSFSVYSSVSEYLCVINNRVQFGFWISVSFLYYY